MLNEALNCRVELWGSRPFTNDLGETDAQYIPLQTVWAEVVPTGGTERDGQANTLYAEVSHKFIIRAKAVPLLTNDMYFLFRGQRYDIQYTIPNYKQRDRLEVYCTLAVE